MNKRKELISIIIGIVIMIIVGYLFYTFRNSLSNAN